MMFCHLTLSYHRLLRLLLGVLTRLGLLRGKLRFLRSRIPHHFQTYLFHNLLLLRFTQRLVYHFIDLTHRFFSGRISFSLFKLYLFSLSFRNSSLVAEIHLLLNNPPKFLPHLLHNALLILLLCGALIYVFFCAFVFPCVVSYDVSIYVVYALLLHRLLAQSLQFIPLTLCVFAFCVSSSSF